LPISTITVRNFELVDDVGSCQVCILIFCYMLCGNWKCTQWWASADSVWQIHGNGLRLCMGCLAADLEKVSPPNMEGLEDLISVRL
jgi:hypothetical protein